MESLVFVSSVAREGLQNSDKAQARVAQDSIFQSVTLNMAPEVWAVVPGSTQVSIRPRLLVPPRRRWYPCTLDVVHEIVTTPESCVHILYLTTRFTSLSHTFITREISQLRSAGHIVSLLALSGAAGEADASQPECDLSGTRSIHPIPRSHLIRVALLELCRRPRRFGAAVGIVLLAQGTSGRAKLRLLYQLVASTTQVRWVEASGIQHIHAHFANPSANYALFLNLLTGIPYSFTGHAADLYRDPDALGTKLKHAAGAVAISEYNLRYYMKIEPGPRRAEVIHCGIDPGKFPFRLRRRTGKPVRILTIGRCTAKKGFRHLLDALAILQQWDLPHQAQLVGYGELFEDLQEQSRRLGLHSMEFTGALQQDVIRDLLDQADIFVLPCVEAPDGDIDGIPVVLMEAMASGCPVISTTVSGIPELIEDGVSGITTSPGDSTALAEAIRHLVEQPTLVEKYSTAGRERVENRFNIVDNCRQLEQFFRSMHAD